METSHHRYIPSIYVQMYKNIYTHVPTRTFQIEKKKMFEFKGVNIDGYPAYHR